MTNRRVLAAARRPRCTRRGPARLGALGVLLAAALATSGCAASVADPASSDAVPVAQRAGAQRVPAAAQPPSSAPSPSAHSPSQPSRAPVSPAPPPPSARSVRPSPVVAGARPVAPPRPAGRAGAAADSVREAGTDAGMHAAADGLRPFLLTPAEIGPGFTAGAEPEPDPTVPAICGGPGVVARFPFAVRVGAAAESPAGQVQETVSVYPDADGAAEAYRATVQGMDCSQGSVGGTPVVLAPAEDLRADLGHDEATGWRAGGQGFDVVMIAVRAGEIVMNFTVLAPEDGLHALPDALVVALGGVQKLLG